MSTLLMMGQTYVSALWNDLRAHFEANAVRGDGDGLPLVDTRSNELVSELNSFSAKLHKGTDPGRTDPGPYTKNYYIRAYRFSQSA